MAVGRAKPRRPRAPDLNGSGYLGMYMRPARSNWSAGYLGMYMRPARSNWSAGYSGGKETAQNIKSMYSAGKNVYSAARDNYPAVSAGLAGLYGRVRKKDVGYEVSHGDGGMEFTEKFKSLRHAKAAEQKYRLQGKKTSLRALFG